MAGTGPSICSVTSAISPPREPSWQRLGTSPGEERRARRQRPGRSVASRRLAEAWIAPPQTRELRELVRFRVKLSNLRTWYQGASPRGDGQERGPSVPQRHVGPRRQQHSSTHSNYRAPTSIGSAVLRDLVQTYDRRDRACWIGHPLAACSEDAGYNAVQAIYGVGQGVRRRVRGRDRRRAPASTLLRHCARGPGSPRFIVSPMRKVHRGRITKQGSVWCGGGRSRQWPATTAATPLPGQFHAIAERRGRTKANVAIARKVLTLVYYGLRDGEIRCLKEPRGGVRLGHDRARARLTARLPLIEVTKPSK